jgi:integrase
MTWRKTRTTSSGKVRHTGLYRDPDGNERSAGTFSRAKDADAAAAAQETLVKTGLWVDPDLVVEEKAVPTLRWYVEKAWWPNRRLELSTRATYDQMLRLYLLPRFGETLLPDIVRSDIQTWLTDLRDDRKLKPYYVAQCYKLLQTILAAKTGVSAVRDGYLAHNPCAGVDLDTIPRRRINVVTPVVSDAIIEAMEPWFRPIPLVVSDSGLRWGEILGLQPRDLAFPDTAASPSTRKASSDGSLTVRRVVTEPGKKITGTSSPFALKEYPKTKFPRTIGLEPKVVTLLQDLIEARSIADDDFIFLTEEGNHISRSVYNKAWKNALTAVGIEGVRPYDLRASNISWMHAGGADLPTIMARAGHVRIDTTRRYTAALPDSDKRAQSALRAVRKRYKATGPSTP